MLGWISSDFFARSPVLIFPLVALCLFILVFTVVSLRVLLQDKDQLDRVSRLPLDDEGVDHG